MLDQMNIFTGYIGFVIIEHSLLSVPISHAFTYIEPALQNDADTVTRD
jgi:hypothetical protein